jgi:hypothetical protein
MLSTNFFKIILEAGTAKLDVVVLLDQLLQQL